MDSDSDASADPAARLARGVAHDFNNLLLAMMLYADTMAPVGVPGEGRADANGDDGGRGGAAPGARAIRDVVERGRCLTWQLQVLAGGDPVSPETFDPRDLLSDLEVTLRAELPASVRLRMRVAQDLRAVFADRERLGEVVRTLVLEAGGRLGTGGTITIVARNGTMAHGGSGPSVSPSVSLGAAECLSIDILDDGPAPGEGQMARIFEPYFASRRLGMGSGLALATCQAIVRRAGGRLTARGRRRGGMRFSIELPTSFSA